MFIKILFYVVAVIGVMFLVVAIGNIIEESGEKHDEKINKVCEDIGLEVLSVSKQLFLKDYVVCYNPIDNSTREIPI